MSNKQQQQFESVLVLYGFVLVSIQIETEEQPFEPKTSRFNSYQELMDVLDEIESAYRDENIILTGLTTEIITYPEAYPMEENMTEQILNLTQHNASPDQIEAGVVEPKDKQTVKGLLTFDQLPSPLELDRVVKQIARLALSEGYRKAMIGGAPFLMHPLHSALEQVGIKPVYAFSVRQSIETFNEETGETEKRNVFKHLGMVVTRKAAKNSIEIRIDLDGFERNRVHEGVQLLNQAVAAVRGTPTRSVIDGALFTPEGVPTGWLYAHLGAEDADEDGATEPNPA